MSGRQDGAIWEGLFHLSPDSGQTLQAQIRQAIVAAILDRQIALSMPLPSCRILAEKLGVARGTVVLAFQQLVDQGFLVARERRGHFVNPDVLAAPPEAPKTRAASRQEGGIDWRARRAIRPSDLPPPLEQDDWARAAYPFVHGQFDPQLFPTAEWRECNRMALAVLEIRNWAADVVDRDDPLLLEQIQARLLPRRGIFASPDEIIVTLGAQNALYMLAQLLVARGATVAMEDPGYPDARAIFQLAGANLAPVPVDREGLVVDRIPHGARFVFATPSHQCPTTVPMSEERRAALLADAERHDRVIIEDGYDAQLLDEAPQQALKSADRSGRVIYVGSLSKTLAPGLRMGFIVASAELVSELRALRRFMLRHPPANNQRAVALFLSLGHHDALVRRLSSAFAERRERLSEALTRFMPDWRAAEGGGGTSVWLQGPPGTDARRLAMAAAQRSVLVEAGNRFFERAEDGERAIRLSISSIGANQIAPGIRELSAAAGIAPRAAAA
ncbi:MAG: 2-aminoadipate aminotransferase [Mesorhizobium amorphae]|nr:MAG: 2-aminoadipate aminotransferase [Mesorhizobium amorphae]